MMMRRSRDDDATITGWSTSVWCIHEILAHSKRDVFKTTRVSENVSVELVVDRIGHMTFGRTASVTYCKTTHVSENASVELLVDRIV
ncbi:hypothetical protein [Paenibacillus sp. IITD108]|uniref:hypothetical protein n=1 Tax=Paenibacillus sp. IITD108 TaxID=3116649 RepID=UPI002F40BE95